MNSKIDNKQQFRNDQMNWINERWAKFYDRKNGSRYEDADEQLHQKLSDHIINDDLTKKEYRYVANHYIKKYNDTSEDYNDIKECPQKFRELEENYNALVKAYNSLTAYVGLIKVRTNKIECPQTNRLPF